jgi:hypothetical protein
MHIIELILALCHISYNKSEGPYAVVFSKVYENKAVLLYAFVAVAIVSKLAGGIEQVAYAQIWDFAPNIYNQQDIVVMICKS